MEEVYNLRMKDAFVSLAVCQGGQGEWAAGEGVLNLSRAFRYAGASNVLYSRWQADLRVVEELFPSFFARNTDLLTKK